MSDALVLCVDDDPTVLNALRTLLSKQLGRGHVVEIAESGVEALEICDELRTAGREFAVVISDFIMPGMRGDELLVRIHELCPNTVTILLTGQSDIDGVKRAINEANLYRFLEKPFNNDDIVLTVRTAHHSYTQGRELARQNEILRHINLALEGLVAKRTEELLQKNHELEHLAVTDRLTGLYNRLKLDLILQHEVSSSERYGSGFSMIMLDIDHFKAVNDSFGHQSGDAVLIEVAGILRQGVPEVDILGRWGGEEFVVICINTAITGALMLGESLRQSVADHLFKTVGKKTVSVGVSTYRSLDTAVLIMQRANVALVRAKVKGRNCVEAEP